METGQSKSVRFSVIAPVFNEEQNVVTLHQQIVAVMQRIGESFEIVFVNDGSTDNSLAKMRELSPLTIINFRKNFGQTAALDAAIKTARGEIIFALDADLQNPPSEIPRLLEKMRAEDLDVVSGWRKKRHDSGMKKFTSRVANLLRWLIVKDGIHDSGCTLKAYKRECFVGVDLQGEMHRFIPAILKLRGFKIGELPVEHRARAAGATKYNWRRAFKGLMDMVAIWFWRKYSARPIHLFGGWGILFISLGMIFAAVALYEKIFYRQDLTDTAFTFFSGFFFLFGIQMFMTGLLADIMVKTHSAATREPYYSIKEIIRQS